MAYYDELNTILNTAISELLNNQNFCKLLYYYPEKVRYDYNPLAQDDLGNTSSLLLNNLFPMPKIPDADTKQNCFVNVTLQGGGAMERNTGFRKIVLTFDIICHLDCWIIKGGYRPFKILAEIDNTFNNKLKKELDIVNRPQPLPLLPQDYSNKFYGYQTSYILMVNSNIEC